MPEENNSGGQAKPFKQSTVVLTLDRENFILLIGGHTENYDEALAMLEMAHRDIEARLRAQQASQLLNVSGRVLVNFNPRGPLHQ